MHSKKTLIFIFDELQNLCMQQYPKIHLYEVLMIEIYALKLIEELTKGLEKVCGNLNLFFKVIHCIIKII